MSNVIFKKVNKRCTNCFILYDCAIDHVEIE